jgi:signal transduction histidine kinase
VAAKTASDATVRLSDVLGRLGARRADIRRCAAFARVCGRSHEPAETAALGLLAATAEVFARRALDHPWRRSDVTKALSSVSELTGLTDEAVRADIHARVALDPSIIQLPPAVAIEMQLKVLFALTNVEHVSLWTLGAFDGLRSRVHVGRGKRDRRASLVARAVLEGTQAEGSATLQGVPVLRWQRTDGVLVFDVLAEDATAAITAARTASGALALVLEREALLIRTSARERALVEPRERLLTRLGFDLHDGPIQDVAALAGDIRLFRSQLADVLATTEVPDLLLGRIDDFEARVGAIDRGLRQMIHSLESPGMTRQPLADALRRETEAFKEETDVPVELVVRGDVTSLTDSQRIAIVRIVQESLTNIREHAHASRVSVAVMATANEIAVDVNDDGRGFDVERTLVRAARAGRLGLLGMSERVRLLGGRFDVRSHTGDGTKVSIVLPAWRPTANEAAPMADTGAV